MSTIEKILLSLQENCNGKKDKLTNSYQERSVWLRNEFDVIRNLIKQNPREHMANKKEPEAASVEPAASSSSSVARESGDGRKRKSPETVNAIKLSPQQKRSSIDVDDLVRQAGLPSDLNKLKKDQLLMELEKRGNTHFSSKNTKNVLIDGLRDTLLSEYQNQNRNEIPEQPILQMASIPQKEPCETTEGSSASLSIAVESESTNMVLSTPSKPASVRKVSMMDFRPLVQNNNAQTDASSKRIEDEYQARMNRQRESIAARKSVLNEAQVALSVAAANLPEPPVISAELPPAAPVKDVAAAAPVLSLAVPVSTKTGDPKDSIGSTVSAASAASGDNIWMEVSSPVRTSSGSTHEEEHKNEAGAQNAVSVGSDAPVRARTESDASFQSCVSTGSNISKASTSSKSGTTTTSSTSASSVRPISSKVSSFNAEKPAVAKSVAPTLMKAKLGLKPIDEPKATTSSAVLKKKDPIPENKPLGSKPVSAVSTSVSAAPIQTAARPVAAPVPVQAAAATPVASAVSVESASANAAPVKRGIFGFLSNSKKNITTAPTGAAASTGTPATAPSTLSSSGGGLFSPSTQSSARTAAPAMVDSIIKSAKLDSAPASVPTPVSVPIHKASPSETSADVSGKGPLNGSGGKIAGTPGAPLNNAFASKSLISNIVNNYNNAVKGTPAPVVASTPAAKPAVVPSTTTAAPASNTSGSVLRDITPAAGNPPPSAVKAAPVAVPATPSAAPAAATSVNEYIIEDRDDSDEEGSGTDGEKEDGEGKKPKQNIPDWARGPLLKEALERQYGMGGQVPVDPDLIFPEVTTCSLEEIFGAREGLSRKYANRSSSAHWEADQMTLVEKRVYRKHMGYDRGQPTPMGAK